MTRASRLSLPVILGACLAATQPTRADDRYGPTLVESTPHITMVGTAKAEVQPDLAVVTLGVVTEAPTARAASDANARTMSGVVDAAKRAGVYGADITTQSVTLTQLYDEVPNPDNRGSVQRPRGFQAANIVSVRIRDISKAGTLTQLLIERGANRFDGIDFTVAHPEPLLTKLTAEAVKNAELLAKTSAEAASARLGQVLLVRRAEGGSRPPVLYGATAARAKAPAPVEAGTTELNVEMEVTWALTPR